MNIEYIKSKVNNYESCSIEEIEEIINYIVYTKKKELGINFEFEIVYDEGGRIKGERSIDGSWQLEIGELPLAEIKNNKELGIKVDSDEERKCFIELVLQTFHELRHIKQNNDIQDNPIFNEETSKMTRESIINDSFIGFRNRFNYEQSMTEIDAMRASLQETVFFFKTMETDITSDEVVSVMKEKELSYLNYNLLELGDSYESVMAYFNQIYGKIIDIKGIPAIIQSLPEDKKEILYSQCQDLMNCYNLETDVEKKMDLLQEMSLIMSPELRQKYPLIDFKINKK